jgi:hypothetical protein
MADHVKDADVKKVKLRRLEEQMNALVSAAATMEQMRDRQHRNSLRMAAEQSARRRTLHSRSTRSDETQKRQSEDRKDFSTVKDCAKMKLNEF